MESALKETRLALCFGGPSEERNISLDSARTFFDALHPFFSPKKLKLLFVSKNKEYYLLAPQWLYSNTSQDFEAEVEKARRGTPVRGIRWLSRAALKKLAQSTDLFCPLVHGKFGEDGQLLEDWLALRRANKKSKASAAAYLGAPPATLRLALDKFKTQLALRQLQLKTPLSFSFSIKEWQSNSKKISSTLRRRLQLKNSEEFFFLKPNNCGSSHGVSPTNLKTLASAVQQAASFSAELLAEKKIYGREFSLIVLGVHNAEAKEVTGFALFPTEISFTASSEDQSFYSSQKKYLPGSGALHSTPATFSSKLLRQLRQEGEKIFNALHFQDWARFDGFVNESGEIIWGELNAIPGFGIDGLFFQQTLLFGLNVSYVTLFLIENALRRVGKPLHLKHPHPAKKTDHNAAPLKVAVVGGGESSERHVSRMSWFNVIQKLSSLHRYKLSYIFLDRRGNFWKLPKLYTLKHTVEEIETLLKRRKTYGQQVRRLTNPVPAFFAAAQARQVVEFEPFFTPEKITLAQLGKEVAFCFLALHGGQGENGVLQKKLEKLGLPFNGSRSEAAALMFDKTKSARYCEAAGVKRFKATRQVVRSLGEVYHFLRRQGLTKKELLETRLTTPPNFQARVVKAFEELNKSLKEEFARRFENNSSPRPSLQWVIKPKADGCSTAVLVVNRPQLQLPLYFLALMQGRTFLPLSLLYPQKGASTTNAANKEMRLALPALNTAAPFKKCLEQEFIFEERIALKEKKCLELTVGVVGESGKMRALLPSKTLSAHAFLTLEEKFNKGMGVNLTPPAELSAKQIRSIQRRIETLVNCSTLPVRVCGYARLDVFYDLEKDDLTLIEVNTLPGLTAATVLFTQALLTPWLKAPPALFLSHLITLGQAEFS